MNLYKLGIMLSLAYSNSEGPFNVEITYFDHYERKSLSKTEIDNFLEVKEVLAIDIIDVIGERRWRNRSSIDRREYWRIL